MKLCIRHADVFTPFERIRDGAVLLQDGLIEWVGTSSALALPPDCLVYEIPGVLLAPGWIDMQINGPLVGILHRSQSRFGMLPDDYLALA